MPIDLNNPAPIDPADPAFAATLRRLQGNILKGHGRDHTVHVFLELRPEPDFVRPRLVEVAERYVTSAARQQAESRQFKEFGIPGALFGSLLLTARGFRTLGFTDAQVDAAFPEAPSNLGVASNFREGLAAHGDELGDPPPADWEAGYGGGRIDAMILLADDDEEHLLRQARELLDTVSQFATVLAVERGNALRTAGGEGIEHFGYVDGRSQPIFLAPDLANEGLTDKWDPSAPLSLVLVPDRNTPEPDSFGSYFVFRKLEQDVLHFKLREQDLADALGLTGPERERAGALVVGRFEDGTPVVLSQTDGLLPIKENNFQYGADPDGQKCPFAAHIRKTNPRGDIGRQIDPALTQGTAERPRRIARRGITYGKRVSHPDDVQAIGDLPTGGVGLLFMCFQASIANQFAFIQKRWANDSGFVRGGVGADPVIGQPGAGRATPEWPPQWGQPGTRPFDFGQFVTMKGGEFFFAPSLPFLKSLSPPE